MKKENTSQPKDNHNFIAAAISLILAAALFAMDMFILLNKPTNVIGILGTTVLMLIWIFFFVRSLFQEFEKNRQEISSYMEALLKSEKAFFLMQRKFEDELHQIEEYSKLPSEQIITAQKAIAKLTINRIRENTDALIESNNQLLEKISGYEEQFLRGKSADTVVREYDGTAGADISGIIANQREIADTVNRMEQTMRDEILKAVGNINEMQIGFQESIRREIKAMGSAAVTENTDNSDMQKPVYQEAVYVGESLTSEDVGEQTELSQDMSPVSAVPDSQIPSALQENLFDSSTVMEIPIETKEDANETAAAQESSVIEEYSSESSAIDQILSQSVGMQEKISDAQTLQEASAQISGQTDRAEKVSPEEISLNTGKLQSEKEIPLAVNITQDTAAAEEKLDVQKLPSMSAVFDEKEAVQTGESAIPQVDGQSITIDALTEDTQNADSYESSKNEIDSLLESLQDLNLGNPLDDKKSLNEEISLSEQLSKESEPAAKAEPAAKPAAKPEPAVKPPAPDLSNPNKMMTPDEIAALLASM